MLELDGQVGNCGEYYPLHIRASAGPCVHCVLDGHV
jgi:hypothetical protein